jgi:hypothetical protein
LSLEFLAGYQFSLTLEQQLQNPKRLFLQPYFPTTLGQFARVKINLEQAGTHRPASLRFPLRTLAAMTLLLVVLSVIAIPRMSRFAWGFVSPPTQSPLSMTIRSLAVLPLENLSNEPAQEYFADGMTDQLITDLGQIKALRVISRTSVMQYKGYTSPSPRLRGS